MSRHRNNINIKAAVAGSTLLSNHVFFPVIRSEASGMLFMVCCDSGECTSCEQNVIIVM
jgi:hypothetical protein